MTVRLRHLIKRVQSLVWLAGILEGIALDNETVCLKAAEWPKRVNQIPISLANVSARNTLDLSSLLRRFFCKEKHQEEPSSVPAELGTKGHFS